MDEVSVRGTTPQGRDRELAEISLAVYDKNGLRAGRWTRLDPDGLADVGIASELLERPESGFRAAIFRDGNQYVLAFAGTDEWKEIGTNIGQAVGKETAQYRSAVHLARIAKVAFGDGLVLTGHSLGGGLASVAASAIDTPAVTFNAAGVHAKSFERVGLDPIEARSRAGHGLVRAYAVKGEILTKMQDALPIPDAAGSRIHLAFPDPLKGIRSVLPISRVMHSVRLHGMESVLAAIGRDSRFDQENPDRGASILNHAGAFLKKSGMSDKGIGLVTDALARKIEKETTAGRFHPKSPPKDFGRSR